MWANILRDLEMPYTDAPEAQEVNAEIMEPILLH